MMDAIERELAEVRARVQRLEIKQEETTKRLDKQDKLIESVESLTLSFKDMQNTQKNISNKVTEVAADVKTLKEKPAKRWESVVEKFIVGLAGAVLAYVLTKVGL